MFLIDFQLSKADSISCSPGTDHMELKSGIPGGVGRGTLAGTTDGLAVNGHDTLIFLTNLKHPVPENTFEILRVQSAEKAVEGIMAGDGFQSGKTLAEKVNLGIAEILYLIPGLRATYDSSHGDINDGIGRMYTFSVNTRVIDLFTDTKYCHYSCQLMFLNCL